MRLTTLSIVFAISLKISVSDGAPVEVTKNVQSGMTLSERANHVPLYRLRLRREVGAVDASICKDKNQFCLLSALSKIAKVRVAEEEQQRSQFDIKNILRSSASYVVQKILGGEAKQDDSLEKDSVERDSKKYKVRCHATYDVYIKDVDEHIPAYICKLEDKTFVLSSTRFLEDRRLRLDVDIDEETFHRLKQSFQNGVQHSVGDSNFKIIPATLVLKQSDVNYKIES